MEVWCWEKMSSSFQGVQQYADQGGENVSSFAEKGGFEQLVVRTLTCWT